MLNVCEDGAPILWLKSLLFDPLSYLDFLFGVTSYQELLVSSDLNNYNSSKYSVS